MACINGVFLTLLHVRNKLFICIINMSNSYLIYLILYILSAGLSSGIAPVYLSELSPVHLRGMIGTVNQFMIVFAILVSQTLGLQQLMGNAALWHYLFGKL
eukprot:GHVU01006755.1.p1 GENE.GHVU01006755.1~~GHVU01006755.1.p1  ORF type:complete len:101 (+),score=2.42 GHVU01006755.1:1-303(+)